MIGDRTTVPECGLRVDSVIPRWRAGVEKALASLRAGRMVVVTDDEDRENEGDLVIAAQDATPEVIAFMVRHTTGILCAPMTGERLDQLEIPLMTTHNTDVHQTSFTVTV